MGIGVGKIQGDLQFVCLARWFSSQAAQPDIREIRGDLEFRKGIFERRCLSCNGYQGQGNPTLFPWLSPSWKACIFRAKEEIQTEGARVRPALSSQGVMAAACKEFSDTDLRDLVTYCIDEFGLEEAKGELPGWMSKKSSTPVLDQAPN